MAKKPPDKNVLLQKQVLQQAQMQPQPLMPPQKKVSTAYKIIVYCMIPVIMYMGFSTVRFIRGNGYSPSQAIEAATFGAVAAPEEPPRNDQPLENLTSLYEKRVFATEDKQGKRTLTFHWFLPYDVPMDRAYPLVIVLHGSPGFAYAGKYLIQDGIRHQYPAFIAVPVIGRKSTWASATGSGLNRRFERIHDVAALANELADTYPIDKNRIYVVGCSEGGYGAFGAMKYYPDVFAGAVALSGGWSPRDAEYFVDTPLFVVHGAKDIHVPVSESRNIAHRIGELGGKIKYFELPDFAHKCPDSRLYTEWTWNWLFSQSK